MANESGLIYQIPQSLIDKAGFLITILQTLGIFVIIWIVYAILNSIFNKRRDRKLDEMNQHLAEIKDILRNRR
ncbi:hypothetical protein COU57_05435 [Candidatus Pacearchaeota archaeon CG10_big_fil_rev_8_21_14_0_10_32_14]|nr:MAG: hypothetical protein COU57_05435 [Candidatus Pacearchaeota archaeon CG10_big_fil_rev_8_21_14_0_10_32_14]